MNFKKCDNYGNILNSFDYGTINNLEDGEDLFKINSNSLLITYRSFDSTIVLNTDSSGIVLNAFSIPGNYGYCVMGRKHTDGNYLFLTVSGKVLKCNINGGVIWQYSNPGYFPKAFAVTSDSCIFFTGYSALTGKCYYGKLNNDEDTLWTKHLNNFYQGMAIDVCSDSGFIMGTYSDPISGSGEFSSIIYANNMGNTLWTQYYTITNGNDKIIDLIESKNGGYLFLANHYFVDLGGNEEFSLLLGKIDHSGNLVWHKEFADAFTNYSSHNLIQDSLSSSILIYTSRRYPPNFIIPDDFRLIKTDSIGNIITNQLSLSDPNSTFNCFPNPNSGDFEIQLDENSKYSSSIEIIDAMGRLVWREPVKEEPFSISLKNQLPPGFYSIRLITTKNIRYNHFIVQ